MHRPVSGMMRQGSQRDPRLHAGRARQLHCSVEGARPAEV